MIQFETAVVIFMVVQLVFNLAFIIKIAQRKPGPPGPIGPPGAMGAMGEPGKCKCETNKN